jgi:hypothetical protein
VAAVAAEFGVGWATVMAAVREYGEPLVDDPTRLDGRCCVQVGRTGQPDRTPRSDRGCELGEGRHAEVCWGFGGDFVMASAEVLDEGVSPRDH